MVSAKIVEVYRSPRKLSVSYHSDEEVFGGKHSSNHTGRKTDVLTTYLSIRLFLARDMRPVRYDGLQIASNQCRASTYFLFVFSTLRPIITSFTKLFGRVNSTFLHRNFSFARSKSAKAFPIICNLRTLSTSATFPSKTLLILNPSHFASFVIINQSLAPVSNNPLNCTPFIVMLINEGLRTLALHSTEFLEFDNKILTVICLLFLSRMRVLRKKLHAKN